MFVNRGFTGNPRNAFVERHFASGPPRIAHDGRDHFHGRRMFGFIPGFGYDYYWSTSAIPTIALVEAFGSQGDHKGRLAVAVARLVLAKR